MATSPITDIKICNFALTELHASLISAFPPTETTNEATLCDLYYATARNFVLADHPWSFAIRRLGTQATLATAPEWGFKRAYAYPPDALRLLQLEDPFDEYQVELSSAGTKIIVSDVNLAKLKYIKEVTDPQLFSPQFAFALAKFLKHLLAGPLTGSRELAESALQEYRLFMQNSKTTDSLEQFPVEWTSTHLTAARTI